MATGGASSSSASGSDTPPPPLRLVVAEVATGQEADLEDVRAKAVQMRYRELLGVRRKAIMGKGAWYWAHLEPVLAQSADAGPHTAVKLRCSLCSSFFPASNPSRTASEHFKRRNCPSFASLSSNATAPVASPKPIAAIAPYSSSFGHRKRCSSSLSLTAPPGIFLSGGQDDLGALAMLEDSVKRLKSHKAFPGPGDLTEGQANFAIALLFDWLYESVGAGAVSLSSIEHPKFRSFLRQVGLPLAQVDSRHLLGPRLDCRYSEARNNADARIQDALFFQLASGGWSSLDSPASGGGHALVHLTLNLPNGTSVFHRAVLVHGQTSWEYAEEVLNETVTDVSGGNAMHRCAGIVADRFKSTALRNLENRKPWMVNLQCQLQAFHSLIKDIARELPLFQSVAAKCYKLASYFNDQSRIRSIFLKYQLQELDHHCLLHLPSSFNSSGNGKMKLRACQDVFAMLEDIFGFARSIQLVALDESYKSLCLEDPDARELAKMIQGIDFWNELDAIHMLVKMIEDMIHEMEHERPLVGQCLPLWDELRSKVKDWCSRFSIDEEPVQKVIEKRFNKCYHPAWSAAFVLDPLYLIKDSSGVSGKYLPPFQRLTPEQEKDVDKLITRLVSPGEAQVALMELMKWRSGGLDPLYARAVQVKQLDSMTGKMRTVNPQSNRLVWETCLSELRSLGKVAVRLIFLHATSLGFKCDPPLPRWMSAHRSSRACTNCAYRLLFVAANSRMERRELWGEEEKDAESFGNGECDAVKSYVEGDSV